VSAVTRVMNTLVLCSGLREGGGLGKEAGSCWSSFLAGPHFKVSTAAAAYKVLCWCLLELLVFAIMKARDECIMAVLA
jgi:hypothetical protein